MPALEPRRTSRLPAFFRRDPFTALREEMEDLRARLWGDEDGGWMTRAIVPALDLSETDTAIDVRMDLPGIEAKDIDIQISGNLLTVSGKREEEKEEKGRKFHRVERSYGSFSRSLTLPCAVVESEIAAKYHDGILTITLPKTEESKAHKIEVKS